VAVGLGVMSMVVIMRIVTMTAARVTGMSMPIAPARMGFRLFEAVGIGVVGLRHGGFLVRFVV
jgi:hypothetical protein